tara:strand:- start:1688 stop:2077 length:390 start_codon:yes stop_codon:yes gene_type:complete
MNDPKPAAGYIRVAPMPQSSALVSIEQQRHAIERCAEQQGFAVIEWYLDSGVRGLTDRQPDLQCLINDSCSQGRPFAAVFTATPSRLSRDLTQYHACRMRLERCGIQLFSTKSLEGFKPDDPRRPGNHE